MEDMLNILLGLDGCYIESKPLLDPWGPREFTISESVDVSLSELVKQILPLSSHYSMLQRFVEEKTCFEYGQVNNALCALIQKILKEYCVSIKLFCLNRVVPSNNANMFIIDIYLST